GRSVPAYAALVISQESRRRVCYERGQGILYRAFPGSEICQILGFDQIVDLGRRCVQQWLGTRGHQLQTQLRGVCETAEPVGLSVRRGGIDGVSLSEPKSHKTSPQVCKRGRALTVGSYPLLPKAFGACNVLCSDGISSLKPVCSNRAEQCADNSNDACPDSAHVTPLDHDASPKRLLLRLAHDDPDR
ncbi:hypothetical protein, partial [Nocardia vinacea]|uniref:hypothetical protein n=1 Tax=Nocardia vinacea TaxID=96468 RepID=UPI001C3F4350